MPMASHFFRHALRRSLCQGLLWALVLAPALGQMHRALHGSGLGAFLHAPAVGEPAAFSVPALFAGHHHTDCQLLDQLTLGDAPPSAGAALVHQPPHAPPAAGAQTPPSLRRVAAFQARGPPLHGTALLISL